MEECKDAASGKKKRKKERQLSMKACGRMRWRFGRQRRKGGIVCQGEMSDMRLSSSPWQGLEWPWL